jgi:hypothetical protein
LPVAQLRKTEADPASTVLEMQEVLTGLEKLLLDTPTIVGDTRDTPVPTMQACSEHLSAMETAFHTEMRYVHGPDWEMKPGKLITKKGTWLKRTTKFSWETPMSDKLYLPEGVALPVMQIGRVTDPDELKLHEWSSQHLRVWLKPTLVESLEARRDVWYVYIPHFDTEGSVIVTMTDTWLKRSCQMSGELQPFELIYVPKGMLITLTCPPEPVTEEWERSRHGHVYQHRKVTLVAPPLTMRRDKFDIFVGQAGDAARSSRQP